MQFINANRLRRKSGVWGTRGSFEGKRRNVCGQMWITVALLAWTNCASLVLPVCGYRTATVTKFWR